MLDKEKTTINQSDLCSEYSQRLLDALPGDEYSEDFRARHPEKFRAICFLHLSFLIDVPLELFHAFSNTDKNEVPPSAVKRILRRSRPCSEDVSAPCLTPALLTRLTNLIDFIEATGAFRVEGVFRKSGNLGQQRKITTSLLRTGREAGGTGESPFLPGMVHEVAGALKFCIAQLSQPLLTEQLLKLFLQAGRLWRDERHLTAADPLSLLARAKQVKALRLLVQLLPETNRLLLARLLNMLTLVTRCVSESRMNAVALGTVFGPLFMPSVISGGSASENSTKDSENLRKKCDEAISLSARLIELSDTLFLLPTALTEDIRRNSECLTLENDDENSKTLNSSSQNRKQVQLNSSPLQTSIRFATLTSVVASPTHAVPKSPMEATLHTLTTNKNPVTIFRLADFSQLRFATPLREHFHHFRFS